MMLQAIFVHNIEKKNRTFYNVEQKIYSFEGVLKNISNSNFAGYEIWSGEILSINQPNIASSVPLLKALANYWCKDSIYLVWYHWYQV